MNPLSKLLTHLPLLLIKVPPPRQIWRQPRSLNPSFFLHPLLPQAITRFDFSLIRHPKLDEKGENFDSVAEEVQLEKVLYYLFRFFGTHLRVLINHSNLG